MIASKDLQRAKVNWTYHRVAGVVDSAGPTTRLMECSHSLYQSSRCLVTLVPASAAHAHSFKLSLVIGSYQSTDVNFDSVVNTSKSTDHCCFGVTLNLIFEFLRKSLI